MRESSWEGRDKWKGGEIDAEINHKDNEHQTLFSASKEVVIVVCKEACNEVKEYGKSNLCMPNAHMRQSIAESIHYRC